MSDDTLKTLAQCAGLSLQWTDYRGIERTVGDDVLQAALEAMQYPAATPALQRASLAQIRIEAQTAMPALLVSRTDRHTPLPPGICAQLQQADCIHLQREDGATSAIPVTRDNTGNVFLAPVPWPGYHRFWVNEFDIGLAVAPRRAWSVDDAGKHRVWGLSSQLYSLRRPASGGDGGVGDYSALATLARAAGRRGAQALAISPVHALFSADYRHFSPYSPSSRLFLNAFHIDAASIVGHVQLRETIAALGLGNELARLAALPLVDWPATSKARMTLLRQLWRQLGAELMGGGSTLALDYRAFRQHGGATLEDHARFEALHAREYARDAALWNWRHWAASLREPDSDAVAEFARAHHDDIGFHIFLQWLASRGLRNAQQAARDAGMAIGLIADLAVGTDNGGSHVWSRQNDFLMSLQVGAPPDAINTQGQDWGLTTFSPMALRQHGYRPFIEMLRANLQHAGGLRIDHILGLRRLWVLPSGASATEGVYLSYPQDDLLNLIALESYRHRAVIIGEDLGTVPPGFSEQLADNGVLGMQVMWFQRDHGLFVEPARWSAQVLATTTTHDLPTVAGWWQGRDIDWLDQTAMLPEGMTKPQLQHQRDADRKALWAAFAYAGTAQGDMPTPENSHTVVDAAIDFVARTPAPLVMIPLEDLLGLAEQPNIPGTIDQHPNWRRRLEGDVETLLDDAAVQQRIESLNAARS